MLTVLLERAALFFYPYRPATKLILMKEEQLKNIYYKYNSCFFIIIRYFLMRQIEIRKRHDTRDFCFSIMYRFAVGP